MCGTRGETLQASGLSPDAAQQRLDHLVEGQSVMLATNELMAATACLFVLGALLIWMARRPTRQFELSQAGH